MQVSVALALALAHKCLQAGDASLPLKALSAPRQECLSWLQSSGVSFFGCKSTDEGRLRPCASVCILALVELDMAIMRTCNCHSYGKLHRFSGLCCKPAAAGSFLQERTVRCWGDAAGAHAKALLGLLRHTVTQPCHVRCMRMRFTMQPCTVPCKHLAGCRPLHAA